ncbi:hypothetical protein AB0M46_04765, partial [Dactylosporangium sp. NPDC051485]|uniref:hypothetical protein n=1 Tax=Dactylosporangium sp. NPDC051485 TaxID=3154846 RepID=UPI00341DB52A
EDTGAWFTSPEKTVTVTDFVALTRPSRAGVGERGPVSGGGVRVRRRRVGGRIPEQGPKSPTKPRRGIGGASAVTGHALVLGAGAVTQL